MPTNSNVFQAALVFGKEVSQNEAEPLVVRRGKLGILTWLLTGEQLTSKPWHLWKSAIFFWGGGGGGGSFPSFGWRRYTSLFFGSGDLDISQVASRIFGGQFFFFRCVEVSTSIC